ncbi:MAG: ExbD/TolR family protein [Phycisphaerales bacterium]
MRDAHFGPTMTPMVDVVMVILIFFMATATFAGSEWFLRSALPRAEAEGAAGGDPFALPPASFELMLSVGTDGRTMASGEGFGAMGLEELPARLEALSRGVAKDDLVLLVRPEAGVPYGDVIRVHDAATSAGWGKVGLVEGGE